MEVRRDPGAKATPSGGLAHFAFYLKLSGLLDSLCEDFPVEYASNNSCSKRDIVGRIVTHGGRRAFRLTSTYACADAVKAALTRIGAFLGWVASTAAQSSREVRWTMIWTCAFSKMLRPQPPDGAIPLPLLC